MGKQFASGKKALGICDRCGWTYKLKELKKESKNLIRQNILVCPECWDQDHPQLQLGRQDFSDAQALRNPRSDSGKRESTSLFGFNPLLGEEIRSNIGKIEIQ